MKNIKQYLIIMFLNKRARSFYWRTVMMAITGIAVIASEEIMSVQVDTTTTVILGLMLGELSKSIRNTLVAMEKDGVI